MARLRGWPLRPTLVSGVIALILLASGAVGLAAWRSSRRVVSDLWHAFANEIAADTTQRTLLWLEPAVPAVALEQRLAAEGKLNPADHLATLETFLALLETHPSFTWVSWAGADGTYLAAFREGGASKATVREQVAPGRTRWRDYVKGASGWQTVRDDESRVYDPRTRPYYLEATAARRGVWTEPFLFTSHDQPGFIYAAPDGTRGVWAIEFELSQLSQFLSTLQIGENGRLYVLTRSGLVVGHPQGQVTEEVNGRKQIARAATHPDPLLREAFHDLSLRGPQTRGFSFGRNLALVADFPAESGIDWRVLGVVPRSDYFAEARTQTVIAVLIGAVCALLASLFGALLTARVSDAMMDISEEMDHIARFELTGRRLSVEHRSLVREVNLMSEATDRMKASLRSFGRYVPRELVQDLLLSGREAVLGGESREITTLFSDIAGFTTLSESMPPDALVKTLGDYFARMSETVREHEGSVDKYIGDAIMAVWGAPRGHPGTRSPRAAARWPCATGSRRCRRSGRAPGGRASPRASASTPALPSSATSAAPSG